MFQKNSNGLRNKTIDILRGLAILSVIFGHITHILVLRSYIWGFHIPLFFFISGLLFQKDRYSTLKSFCPTSSSIL